MPLEDILGRFTVLADWFQGLQQQAFARWSATLFSGIRCAVVEGHRASTPVCSGPAVGQCGICMRPTCLRHAMVARNGDVVCLECINRAAVALRGQGFAPGSEPSVGRSPPPPSVGRPPGPDEEHIYREHLRVFGLKPGATPDQIKAAYRKLVAKHHPDRAPPAKREAATERLTKINAAFQYLKQRHEGATS